MYSSMGVGPTAFLVTSRLRFASRHSSSWMLVSASVSLTAVEYVLHLVRKYCQPSVVPPAEISGLRTGVGLGRLVWLWASMWPLIRAATTAGSVPPGTSYGQPGRGQFTAMPGGRQLEYQRKLATSSSQLLLVRLTELS